ncbi:uncharacterized protein LOC131224163 [Magnolia sinica]|uniref:uncharacterized protein LOC131224163 n=1 Tax=Magnolia sinica TaxID=86752 RepID=UPI002659C886|nr:uncharacterized protein LOC131224163 [Magnolia sinica]
METLRSRGGASRDTEARGADIFDRFLRLHPPIFRGVPDPVQAKHWLARIAKMMGPLECSDAQTVSWATTKFLEKYFPRSCRSEKIAQFLKFKQGSLTVAQYKARFDELSQYVPEALEDKEYKLEKFKEGLKPGIQSRLCTWDFGDFPKLVDKAIRVEKDFESTICSRQPARDALFRPRQPPLASPVSAGRSGPLFARAPPLPPGGGCGYCRKENHNSRNCFKRLRDQGLPPRVNRPLQNQTATRVAPRPQQPRQAPPARVYVVATIEAKQDPLQTIHGTAHINGTPVLTLFDSGTTLSFIDSAIASRLELNTT